MDSGKQYLSLEKHEAEVVNVEYGCDGDKLLSSSFDGTARLWDVRTGKNTLTFQGHSLELSNAVLNFSEDLVATGSLDG